MISKSKKRKLRMTFKSKDVWIWSILYHTVTSFLTISLPRYKIVSLQEAVYGLANPNPVFSPFVSLIFQLFIYDVILSVVFVLTYDSKGKKYDFLGVLAVSFLTSIIFAMFTRILLVNSG